MVVLAAPPPEPTPTPPPALTCLAKHYAVTPALDGAAWFAVLPDGTRIAWDDGRTKTDEETLDDPDVEDVFAEPYSTGPIVPNHDMENGPGRVRLEKVFRATYGDDAKAVEKKLVAITFAGKKLRVHEKAKDAFVAAGTRVAAVIAADPTSKKFLEDMGGTFVWRKVAGTNRASSHSFGVSLDFNPSLGDYWRWAKGEPKWTNRVPQPLVDAMEAEGFVWGGRWGKYDTMHFEWRPELYCANPQPEPTEPTRSP